MQDNVHEEITEKIKIITAMQDDLNAQLSCVYSEMNKARDKPEFKNDLKIEAKADQKVAKSTYDQIVYVMGHVQQYTERTLQLKAKFAELGERTQRLKYAIVK